MAIDMTDTRTALQVQMPAQMKTSFQTMFSNIEQGIFIVGTNGQVSFCNARFEELVGIKSSEVVGQSYETLLGELAALSSNTPKTAIELRLAAAHPGAQTSVNFKTRSQANARLQIKFFPIYDLVSGQEAQIGWGGLVLDTTTDWNEIGQWAAHLSTVTHSLRTSVATIKGFVTTLLSGHRYWEEGERQGFLETINDHVDQLSRLLENAQELFRLEVDGVQLDRRSTDLKRLIQRVTQSVAYQKNAHQLAIEVPDSLPPVEVDPLRIEQVLHNLLDNAVKFSPRDKKIRVAAYHKDDALQVSVTDQGVGIPAEHLKRIFEGFYQVEYGSTDAARGLGMGLYVARELVLAHGGRIWAESFHGQGTTISFTIPLQAQTVTRPAESSPQRLPALAAQPQAPAALDGRPSRDIARVLVVDDDPQMLRLMKIKLEVEGYEVITATRGSIALELAVAEQPDIILLDVGLPDTSGVDLCGRLREFTAVPVIMISGLSREEDMVSALDAGADDYLVKPVRNKELVARLRANLRRSRVPEQAPSKTIFRVGDLAIDFAQRQVTVRGDTVRLTPTEYKLLYHMAVNAGRILTHSQLLSKVWGPGYEEDTQYLWVNISRLRGKLEKNPGMPEYILTEPGVGYFLPEGQKGS